MKKQRQSKQLHNWKEGDHYPTNGHRFVLAVADRGVYVGHRTLQGLVDWHRTVEFVRL